MKIREWKLRICIVILGMCSSCFATYIVIPKGTTSIRNGAFYWRADITQLDMPNSVTSVGNSAFEKCSSLFSIYMSTNLLSIGAYAFSDCSSLGSIYIANSVTNIGAYAFSNCSSLKYVRIAGGVEGIGNGAFSGCKGLANDEGFAIVNGWLVDYSGNETNVKIQKDVTGIGASAFSGCSNLKSVAMSDSVTSIGGRAFSGCSSLTEITIPIGVSKIENGTFYGCNSLESITIPDSVTSIGREAFWGCSSLTSLEIPDGVTSIGESALKGCSSLTSLEIPDGVTSIGESALEGCSSLTEITIPSGVLNIGDYTFYGCSSLESITIPDSVTSIGRKAFWGCSNLTSIAVSSNITDVGEGIFSGCSNLHELELFSVVMVQEMCLKERFPDSFEKLERVILGEGVKVLPDGFFDGCEVLKVASFPSTLEDFGDNDVRILGERMGESGLWIKNGWVLGYIGEAPSEVKVPEGVIGIASYAFEGQATLESIILPSSLRTIRTQAFARCTSLAKLDLPEGITQIENGAFQDCTWLQELSLPKSLTYLGNASFANCTSLSRLYCQEGLVEIGDAAFSNCWKMLSVSIPATLDKIGTNAFWGCSSLTGATVPTHVKPIAELLPQDIATRLKTIVIADGETELVANAFAGCAALEKVVLPSSLTEIPDNAFKDCATLTEITFPSNVLRIGTSAFSGCSGISELHLPSKLENIGESAFSGCSGISELHLPSQLEYIGAYAFNGLDKLTNVTIPSSVKEIGADAFEDCPNITTVTMPIVECTVSSIFPSHGNITSVTLVGGSTDIPVGFLDGIASIKSLSVPDNITSIGHLAFRGLELLEEVDLSSCLTNIAAWAFEGLNRLTSVTIPPSVTHIGYGAFGECPNIREISLPGNIAKVADVFPAAYNTTLVSATVTGTSGDLIEGLFQDCSSLKSVTIPTCVTNIGAYAFSGCSQLEPITLWDGIESIGNNAFYGVKTGQSLLIPNSVTSIGANAFGNCLDIRSVTMPAGLCVLGTVFSGVSDKITSVTLTEVGAEIPDNFLYNCSAVSSITIPEGVTKVGAYAFSGTSLATIEIPSTVTNIGANAFAGLALLEDLTLPAALQEIGDRAFAGCSRLTSLSIPKGVTALGANVFDGCEKLETVYYLTEKAPSVKDATYQGTPSTLTSYVLKGSTAWDGLATSKALPQAWPSSNGRAIEWWEPNIFNVTFIGNGGTPESQTVAETTWSSYVLPSEPLERQGFTFTGWWTEPINGGEVKASTKVKLAQPHTLYAHWRQNTYIIKFDLNGAVGELPSLEMKYGDTKELPLCKIPRLDYRFAGWSWTPEGSVDFVDGASVCNLTTEDADELTLYAVWEPHTWSIANYLNAENLSFTVTGDAEWMPDVITNHDGIASMRSGVIGTNQQSTLKTSVKGKGTLSFWWKVICEPADSETGNLYDYLELTIDGGHPETAQPIAGDVDWTQVTVRIDGEASEHEIAWSFVKDGFDDQELTDVAWVDEIIWTPDPVTLSFCADDAIEGDAPSPIISAFAETIVLPEVGSLARDGYAFVGWSDGSSTYEPGSTYEVGSDDVVFVAIWRELSISDILNAPDFIFTTGGDAKWAIDTTITYDGVASLRSGAIVANQESWVETSVSGAGTLSFWWKSDGLIYRNNPANYVQIAVDGTVVSNVAVTGWSYVSVNISEKGGHTVRWTYKQTRQQTSGENCAWLDEVSWKDLEPSVEGDADAKITGDAEKGYVITPSEGAKEVKVSIPDGVDKAKVTVKVSPEAKVTPNGAAVKVMRGEDDITDFLNMPTAVDGVIDLNAATVKEEYVKEPFNLEKGAKIDLSSITEPTFTTAPTQKGLTYRLKEGTTLEEMRADTDGDSKIGDGTPWTPAISEKGGTSAFYTIEVTK